MKAPNPVALAMLVIVLGLAWLIWRNWRRQATSHSMPCRACKLDTKPTFDEIIEGGATVRFHYYCQCGHAWPVDAPRTQGY